MKKTLLFVSLTIVSLLCSLQAKADWSPTNGPYGGEILSLGQNSTTLFAGVYGYGVFRSTDGGVTWSASSKGLPGTSVYRFLTYGSTVYAATDKGVGISTNDGVSWTTSMTTRTVYRLALLDTNVFAVTTGGMYVTSVNATKWKASGTGFKWSAGGGLAVMGKTIYAGSDSGIFMSTDAGANWVNINHNLPNPYVFNIDVVGSRIFVSTWGSLYTSDDNGSTWSATMPQLLDSCLVYTIVSSGSKLFASTHWKGMLMSGDNGTTWQQVNAGLPAGYATYGVMKKGSQLFAATDKGIYASTNEGVSWAESQRGLNTAAGKAFEFDASGMFACTSSDIYHTTDNGNSWKLLDGNVVPGYINAIMKHGSDLFVADAYVGVLHSSNNGVSWDTLANGMTTVKSWSLGQIGDVLFVGCFQNAFRSTNNGQSWESAVAGIYGNGISSYVTLGNKVFCMTSAGVFESTDSGITWSNTTGGVIFGTTWSLTGDHGKLYVGSSPDGAFVSSDSGLSWTAINGDIPSVNLQYVVAKDSVVIAALTQGAAISADGGQHWVDASAGLPLSGYTYAMTISGNDVLIGSDFGFFRRPISELVALSGVASPVSPSLELSISPNPTAGIVTVRTTEAGELAASVVDVLGNELVNASSEGSIVSLDMKNMPAGAYYIRVSVNGKTMTKLVVRQ